MFTFLDSIRRKPKAVRQLYAFWGAALVTVPVAIIWFGSLAIEWTLHEAMVAEVATTSSEMVTQGGAFSRSFDDLTSSFMDAWQQFRGTTTIAQGIFATSTLVTEVATSTETTSTTTSNQFMFASSSGADTPKPNPRPVFIATTSATSARELP